MTRVKTARAKRIAGLNDRLRKEPANRSLGQVLMSRGVASRGAEFQAMVLAALAGIPTRYHCLILRRKYWNLPAIK